MKAAVEMYPCPPEAGLASRQGGCEVPAMVWTRCPHVRRVVVSTTLRLGVLDFAITPDLARRTVTRCRVHVLWFAGGRTPPENQLPLLATRTTR